MLSRFIDWIKRFLGRKENLNDQTARNFKSSLDTLRTLKDL